MRRVERHAVRLVAHTQAHLTGGERGGGRGGQGGGRDRNGLQRLLSLLMLLLLLLLLLHPGGEGMERGGLRIGRKRTRAAGGSGRKEEQVM